MNTSIDFNEKKGFICDMDGVIYHGNHVLPGVSEFIQWLHEEKKEYLFLTNNSGYTPKELNQKLARMGLDVPEEHFYTSALATAAFLKEQAPGCSVFVIGEAGLLNALYDAGITMNDVNPDYVVVGEGRSYFLDTLTKATNLVLKGAKLIGANSDVSGPIQRIKNASKCCGIAYFHMDTFTTSCIQIFSTQFLYHSSFVNDTVMSSKTRKFVQYMTGNQNSDLPFTV